MMRLGKIARHLGIVEMLTEQRDDFTGEPLQEWDERSRSFVGFDDERESLVDDGDKIERLNTIVAVMRYPGFPIEPGVSRIRARGQVYNVIGAVPIESKNRWVRLTLKRG